MIDYAKAFAKASWSNRFCIYLSLHFFEILYFVSPGQILGGDGTPPDAIKLSEKADAINLKFEGIEEIIFAIWDVWWVNNVLKWVRIRCSYFKIDYIRELIENFAFCAHRV